MNSHDDTGGKLPTHIPFALVPKLLNRDQAAVSRLAARYRWPLEVVPGYAKRQRIALADLEAVTGFKFTVAQVADAERRHRRDAEQARVRRNAGLNSGAVFDLGLTPNRVGDATSEGVPAEGTFGAEAWVEI